MGRRSKLSEDDKALFRDAVGEVRPIRQQGRAGAPRRPPPEARQRQRDERAVLDELLSHELDPATLQTGEELSFERPGLRKTVLRKLRRGHYVVESELDLHGLSADQARAALADFLTGCLAQGRRCVRVIHGKGRRSSNEGPVLKPLVNRWLRLRDDVLAFCSARPVDGGTGALYVLLKKRD